MFCQPAAESLTPASVQNPSFLAGSPVRTPLEQDPLRGTVLAEKEEDMLSVQCVLQRNARTQSASGSGHRQVRPRNAALVLSVYRSVRCIPAQSWLYYVPDGISLYAFEVHVG